MKKTPRSHTPRKAIKHENLIEGETYYDIENDNGIPLVLIYKTKRTLYFIGDTDRYIQNADGYVDFDLAGLSPFYLPNPTDNP